MTVQQLIDQLAKLDPHAEVRAAVRAAVQPAWPFEHEIDSVHEVVTDDEDVYAYLAVGEQIGYLPSRARRRIGWVKT